jgi:flagellar basal-body rod protein FlgG
MLEGLHSAAAGMAAQQERISAVSNDLANVSTSGYKHVRVGFHDLIYQEGRRPAVRGTAAQVGKGVATVDAGRSTAQGSLQRTDSPLDVAIQGQGYLRVRLADGRQALTRDGAMHLDDRGRLTSSTGALMQPAITVPKGLTSADVRIAQDGTVSAGGRRLGRLDVVTVRAPQALTSVGENAFVPSPASGAPTRAPASTFLSAGALEASNVDMSDAMVEMIDAQRSYQLASKAIETADQMMEIANGVRR